MLVDGDREEVIRPRVRRVDAGASQEVPLAAYQAACDPAQLSEVDHPGSLQRRQYSRNGKHQTQFSGGQKIKRSRHWQQVGHQFVDKLRKKDLSKPHWVALMLDGIRLSKDQLAVVAIGITAEGFKIVLDFELGSSESAEVSKDLMRQLIKRGFACEHRLFATLDGSDALRSAVKAFFPDSIIQRCLVHKERNIRSKLSKKHWANWHDLFQTASRGSGQSRR